ncbi:MAG: radical SAM protein, partial [Planctomycetes bacterium]|nr:radical SAM protein [Planctomycetota bacterium]
NNPRICPHFHIPLQSGSDRILKLMKRPYTSEGFKKLILKLHEAGPFVSIGIDVMAGFPGETEEDIEQTIRFLGELPVTYFHVFPYSRRKGTPAARFEGQVVKSVAEGRCKKLRDLGSAKKKDFYEKNIGRTDQVLVESNRDKETDRLKGFSRNYIPVLLEGDDELQGQVVKVRLQEVKGEQMLGEIIS